MAAAPYSGSFFTWAISPAPRIDAWEQTIKTLHEDSSRHQLLFIVDADGDRVRSGDDVLEVKLDTMTLRHPRRLGDCRTGCKLLWAELGLRSFREERRAEDQGDVPWHKVLELLKVNRLLALRSKLYVHGK